MPREGQRAVRWTSWQVWLLVGSLATMLAGGALLFSPAIGAAEVTITVTGTGDGTGACSGSGTNRSCTTLRAAVLLANGLSDPVRIELQEGTYQLSIPPATDDTAAEGDLDITKRGGALRIEGQGSDRTTIAGGWSDTPDRLFDVESGATLVLAGVKLTGGRALNDDPSLQDGGAIWVGGVVQLDDVVFEGNEAGQHGGALFVAPTGTVTLAGGAGTVQFRNNEAGTGEEASGNGGALASAGLVVLDGRVLFIGNQASGAGGAIWVQNGRMMLGSRTVIGGSGAGEGNQAGTDGGGIAVDGGALELQGTVVRGNRSGSEGRGGGMWVARGQVTLRGATVAGNSAKAGGGIASDQGQVTVLDSEIRANTAEHEGGGLALLGRGTGQIVGGTIADNLARTGDGGGILNRGTLALSRTVIENNSAEAGAGGGIANGGTLTLSSPDTVIVRGNRARSGGGLANTGSGQLRSLIVQGNSASQDGGGIWNNGDLVLDGATIDGNQAQGSGGGIYHTGNKQLTVTGNSLVRSNSAVLDGGGIAALGKLAMAGVTVEGNQASGSAGGVLVNDQAELRSVQLIDNQAQRDGGALVVDRAGKLTGIDTAVRRSTAGQLGGGIVVREGGQLTLQAVSITENQATSYGGGLAILGTAAATNTTISTNVSQQNGGGLWVGPRASLTLQFVTVASNAAAAGGALYNDGGTVTLRGVIVASSPGGGNCGGLAPSSQGGNLEDRDSCLLRGSGDLVNTAPDLQPLQVDATTGSLFHALGVTSAALDAAGTQSCPSDDQLHTVRPQGGACDIGAFEYPVPEVTPVPTVQPTGTPSGTPVPPVQRSTPTPRSSPVAGSATPIVSNRPTPTPTIGLPATGTDAARGSSRAFGLGLVLLGSVGAAAGTLGLVSERKRAARNQ